MQTKTLTIDGKRYKLTAWPDGAVTVTTSGLGDMPRLPPGVTLSTPDLREHIKATVARSRENKRVAGEQLRAAVLDERGMVRPEYR